MCRCACMYACMMCMYVCMYGFHSLSASREDLCSQSATKSIVIQRANQIKFRRTLHIEHATTRNTNLWVVPIADAQAQASRKLPNIRYYFHF